MEFLFILHCLSFLSVSVKRCEKITKGVDRVVAHSTYYITIQPLAPRDIFITSLTSEYRKTRNFRGIKTHGSESRGQEEAAVRDERVSYLHVALL